MTFSTFFRQDNCATPSLPDEIIIDILKQLSPADIRAFGETNTNNANLIQDPHLWRSLYKQAFYPDIPFLHSANQYLASFLYQQADQARADIAQYQFRRLDIYLQRHHSAHWADYFKGMLLFYGKGCPPKPENGFDLLLSSMDKHDHRAIFAILGIYKTSSREDRKKWEEKLSQRRLSAILDVLSNIDNGESHYWLAWLYAHGLGTSENLALAENYYLSAIHLQHLPAIKSFIYLKCQPGKFPFPDPQQSEAMEHVITIFTSLLDEHQHHTAMIAELYFQIGWLYNHLQQTSLAIDFLSMAVSHEHPQACIEMSILYYAFDDKEGGLKLLQQSAIAGSKEGARKWFNWAEQQLTPEDLTDRLEAMTKISPKIFAYLSDILATPHHDTYDELIDAPGLIWWHQFNAQCGNISSLTLLKSMENTNYPYVYCALGILYEYGILHSNTITPNHAKATNYFHKALLIDQHAISNYMQTGIKEGLLYQHTQRLLENHNIAYSRPKRANTL